MGKTKEEKILEEIRRRVLARDESLQQRQEEEQIRDATRESLANLTTLSREEVDAIADAVRKEYRKKSRMILFSVLGIFLVLCFSGAIIAYQWFAEKQVNTLVETFDNNRMQWFEGKQFTYNRYIEDGKYIIEANKDEWCFWDDIPVNLPRTYTLEVTTTWMDGRYGGYGLMLMQDDDNCLDFRVRADGAATMISWVDDEMTTLKSWTDNVAASGGKGLKNVLKYEVTPTEYLCSVNGNLFYKAPLPEFDLQSVGIRCCGFQQVAFDDLKVTNTVSGIVVLNETFDSLLAGWGPKNDIEKVAYFDHGEYIFETDLEELCHQSTIPFKLGNNAEVEVMSTWLRGEKNGYGIVFYKDEKNYYMFELRNDGMGRYYLRKDGDFVKISNHKLMGDESHGNNQNRQTIRINKNMFHYLVNGKVVESYRFEDLGFEYVGIRACGSQTIAFDNFKISSN